MLPDRTYDKPPLVEVLCDFYFDTGKNDPWDAIQLGKFAESACQKGYPHEKRMPGAGPTIARAMRKWRGRRRGDYNYRHRFTSEDGNRSVQVGENLLVVNQTPPYYGWTKFKAEALEQLDLYLSTWPSPFVVHAGLHYVDVVEIPGDSFYIDDYLNFYPVIPSELTNRAVNNLVMAFEIEGSSPGDVCTIHYQQRPASDPGANTFRFHWDYVSLDGFEPTSQAAGKWLDAAHDFLHDAFRSAYTAKCADLFLPREDNE